MGEHLAETFIKFCWALKWALIVMGSGLLLWFLIALIVDVFNFYKRNNNNDNPQNWSELKDFAHHIRVDMWKKDENKNKNKEKYESSPEERLDNFCTFFLFFAIINSLLSLGAVGPNPDGIPYEYWTFIRIVYTSTSLFVLYKFSKNEFKGITDIHKFIFLVIAFLFNPIFIIKLTPYLWSGIHMAYAVFLSLLANRRY